MDKKLALNALRGLLSIEDIKSPLHYKKEKISKVFLDDESDEVKRALAEIFVLSVKIRNEQVAHLALASGAIISLKMRIEISGMNPYGAIVHSMESVGLLTLILSCGFDVNAPLYRNKTALHLAVADYSAEIVEALLEAKADPNIRNLIGFTSVMFASIRGDLEILKLLIAAGGDPWMCNKDGKNSLKLAILNRNIDCVNYLKVLPKPRNKLMHTFKFILFYLKYHTLDYQDVYWKRK